MSLETIIYSVFAGAIGIQLVFLFLLGYYLNRNSNIYYED